MTTKTVDLQNYTSLPLKTVAVAGKSLPDVIVSTPHKGEVHIKLKEEHRPFIFGSFTQTDVHANSIISDILYLEKKSKEYLLEEWKETI